MPPYRYPALPPPQEGKHVRLLRLSPGDFSDDLHVELKQVLLDGTPNYEALSYVWGSSANPVSLLVGPSRKHTISVTQNLATALQHLRDANESRTLWVDAVCIDQSDVKERSYQVTLMSDIYRAAHQVIVWLGPEEDDFLHAFNMIHAIGSSIEVDWHNHLFKETSAVTNSPHSLEDQLHLDWGRGMEFEGLYRLLNRQWFERLWVRQEIGLATQAIILCGKLVMPWYLFSNTIFFLKTRFETHGGSNQWAIALNPRLQLVYRVCDRQKYSLHSLRREIYQVKCTDPRDRIYGILSLLHPNHQSIGIIPDYTRSVGLVYQDVTLNYIKNWNRLSILLQCELQDASLQMPTWVPDWTVGQITAPISILESNANAYLRSITSSKRDGILSVAGLAAATIHDVRSMHFGTADSDFLTMLMVLWELFLSNSATFAITETSWLSAACDALCCGIFCHVMVPNRKGFPDFKSVLQTFKSRLTTEPSALGTQDFADDWATYQNRVRKMCRHRSFFLTTKGSVGIAPVSARPGDKVCVLLGCESTVVLRQTEAKTYQFVGQSYMSGVNTGEVLLGPLPEHLQAVNRYDANELGYRFAYWNELTKQVQYEDPRLDKLLINPGFLVRDLGENRVPMIQTSVEALQNAGIAAQYFDLV